MQGPELTVRCVQAAFHLGHPVDTTEAIRLPDGVREHRKDHLTDDARVGAKSKLPKLVIEFPESDMATVTIYPSGKVEVSKASSERAAHVAAEAVRSALLRPGDEDDWDRDFAGHETQIVASYAVLPKVIKKEQLYLRLQKMYNSGVVTYEPEIPETWAQIVRLVLNQGATTQGVSKGRVEFEFCNNQIIVFLKIFNEAPIDKYLTDELQADSRSAADLLVETNRGAAPDAREALEKAVKKIVGGGRLKDLGARPKRDPAGGFISRHRQIQEWLSKTHPELNQLPDYDPEWGDPGRANPLSWANTPWAGFWEEHMRPVLTDLMRNLKRKREEQEPAEMIKSLHHYSDTLANSDTATHESAACATSRYNLIERMRQLAEEIKKHQQLAADDKLFGDALQDELELPVTRSLAANDGAGYTSTSAGGADSAPNFRSCSGDDSSPSFTSCSAAESAPSFLACSAGDSAPSAGARRATADRILPWPGTARRRSYAGVEVPPGKKLTVGEANEAPCDAASRMLQALEAFECKEAADLHEECVRICKLIIAS